MARQKHPRLAQVERAFSYHQPASKDISAQLDKIRAMHKALATKMHKLLPENREASLALTNLEQASMFAIAAVVRESGEPSTSVAVNGKAAKAAAPKAKATKAADGEAKPRRAVKRVAKAA
jgi:hypothetical protein